MLISSNSLFLIETLEGLPLLDGRYQNIRCVNVDKSKGSKRGCFSLVFKAFDIIEEKHVALKFFDIAPENMTQDYRRAGFRRERELLALVKNQKRCLQLASSLQTF